jgi:hypothetical protein
VEGSKVEVNYKGKGKWFKGTVDHIRLNGTFDIKYDDGDRETGVDKENMRLQSTPKLVDRTTRLEEGMKVEVNYKGKGKWFKGKIKREHSDGTFDIEYDDGDRETYVEKQNVRPRDGAESSNGGKPREGDKVKASCKGSTRKYPGTIHADNYDGTFDIKFDDGDRDRAVPERSVETEQSSSTGSSRGSQELIEGQQIEADFQGRGRFYAGRIARVRLNGTFDINYDDGEKEVAVDRRSIRAGSVESTCSSRQARLEEGMKVEVNYKGKGKWFKGKISRVRLNGTFDVNFDDGDRETGVEKENIRAAESAPALKVDSYGSRGSAGLSLNSDSRARGGSIDDAGYGRSAGGSSSGGRSRRLSPELRRY